jgi:hypothetical protein
MSTHIGKIGRLSKGRREELGERMEDGQTGKELAEWLNSLPDVQALLKEKFGGLPVNEQNVTNWRQSGHLEWLRLREGRARVLRVVSDAEEFQAAGQGQRLGDCLAAILAVELDGLGRALLGDEEADLEKRWERFCEVHRQVSRLRRDDDRVKRTALREQKSKIQSPRSKVGEEKEVQSPRSKGQSLEGEVPNPKSEVQSQNGLAGAGGGTPPELAGGDACATEAGPPTQGFRLRRTSTGQAGTAREDEHDDEDENERGDKSAERPAIQDESRQIKVENQSKVQSPESKVQGLKAEITGLKGGGDEDCQRNGSQRNDGDDGQGDGAWDETERDDWEKDERILNAVVTPLTREDEKRLAEENRLWRIKAGFDEPMEKAQGKKWMNETHPTPNIQ